MQFVQLTIFGLILAATTFALPGKHEEHADYYAHPKYHYDYAVHDLHTGDVKNKWETRDGDVVKGAYSLNEPDGTILKVEYTADKHNGFNAVVHRLGKAIHPEEVHSHGGHYANDLGHQYGDASSLEHGNNVAYDGYHH